MGSRLIRLKTGLHGRHPYGLFIQVLQGWKAFYLIQNRGTRTNSGSRRPLSLAGMRGKIKHSPYIRSVLGVLFEGFSIDPYTFFGPLSKGYIPSGNKYTQECGWSGYCRRSLKAWNQGNGRSSGEASISRNRDGVLS